MKKLLLLCMTIGTFACTNQIIESIPNSVSASGDTLLCLEGVIWNETYDMLVFDDSSDFWNIYACLEKADSAWVDYQLENYCATEAQQDSFATDLANGQFKILNRFEGYFGYSSYRSTYISDFDSLELESEGFDWENSPFEKQIISPIFSTILNENGEFMVHNTIYIYKSNHDYFEITNGQLSTLDSIRNNLITPENLPSNCNYANLKIKWLTNSCLPFWESQTIPKEFEDDNKEYKIIGKSGFNSISIIKISYATSWIYKKINNTNIYRPAFYRINTGIGGVYRDEIDCDASLCTHFNQTHFHKRQIQYASTTACAYGYATAFQEKKYDLNGNHQYNSTESLLTFIYW